MVPIANFGPDKTTGYVLFTMGILFFGIVMLATTFSPEPAKDYYLKQIFYSVAGINLFFFLNTMFGNPGVQNKIFKYHSIRHFGCDASVLNKSENEKQLWDHFKMNDDNKFSTL